MSSTKISPANPSFRGLACWWSDHLGHHQVPVHNFAADINELLSPDAVHHELIHEVVRRVYSANRCGHLGASISLENTFTVLGEVQKTLLSTPDVDVDQMKLLDDIGWSTRQYFTHLEESARDTSSSEEIVDTTIDSFNGGAALNRV